MSLYLGNLSSRVPRDDLERVFNKFGRNSIRIKDGFGFVVYDVPKEAERALRELNGKHICGERRITIAWSREQPKYAQRFVNGSRFVGRKLMRRDDYGSREDVSYSKRGVKLIRQQEDEGVGTRKNVADTEGVAVHRGEKRENVKKCLADESNVEDTGRWGESILRVSARGRSKEKSQKNRVVATTVKHPSKMEDEPKCYICGRTGHTSRNCPEEGTLWRNKNARLGRARDNDFSFRVQDKITLASQIRSTSTRSPRPSRHTKRDGDSLGSRKLPRIMKDKVSASPKDIESQRKRKRTSEDGRKGERACSPPKRTGSTAFRSSSVGIRSSSRSRSASSRTNSKSSSSRSMSTSLKSRSEISKSKTMSDSHASFSSSISPSQPLHSSPGQADLQETDSSEKDHLENNKLAQENFLTDQTQIVGEDTHTENSPLKNTSDALFDVRLSSTKVVDEMNIHKPFVDPSEDDKVSIDNLSSESMGEDFEESGPPEYKDISVSHEKQDVDDPLQVHVKNSTSISVKELHIVLEHYRLAMPNDNEQNLSVDSYFGSARLWPWELIYYRRIKKGLISTQNYAKRISQNEEFGIVDKYVRSSSGWEECEQNNC
ncbi:hypothetical protein ACHQM5_021030 [Ranunculus cassubicifolius]